MKMANFHIVSGYFHRVLAQTHIKMDCHHIIVVDNVIKLDCSITHSAKNSKKRAISYKIVTRVPECYLYAYYITLKTYLKH